MIGLLRALMAADAVESPEDATDLPHRLQAEMLLEETRDELTRADGKASILLGASGVVAAALFAGALSRAWDPTDLEHAAAQALFWFGLALTVLGITCLALAVSPRTKHDGDRSSLAYFGHVVQYQSVSWWWSRKRRRETRAAGKSEFQADLKALDGNALERVIDQVWVVSSIVNRKYRMIKSSLRSFGLAGGACAIAVLVDAVLK